MKSGRFGRAEGSWSEKAASAESANGVAQSGERWTEWRSGLTGPRGEKRANAARGEASGPRRRQVSLCCFPFQELTTYFSVYNPPKELRFD